jgi:hypothetical protein
MRPDLSVETVPLARLMPYTAANARTHSDAQVAHLGRWSEIAIVELREATPGVA